MPNSSVSSVKKYSLLTDPTAATTGNGLDQIVEFIQADSGLAGATDGRDIRAGAGHANSLNQMILEAANATGAAADGRFTAAEVVAMNAYIRSDPARLAQWTALHGDDEDGSETGFHLVQNDGATTPYRGQNLVNTVADGIFHLGFAIQNGRFLNEDGNENASVQDVADWLTQFFTDHSTTHTGLDRITNLVMADKGLDARIPDADIAGGADAANGLNRMIIDAMTATGALSDNRISTDDLVAMNAYIRSDPARLAQWTALHGDDEDGSETGFHLVQNDGATTRFFGQNLVNTVADGIYHMGFAIQNGRFLNEDGNENATLTDVADWLNYFYVDQSTTGTGLDRIVDLIKDDRGLARNTNAGDISAGAQAADDMNHIITDLITATGAAADGWITAEDLRAMNAALRADANLLARWTALHGDDEDGSETGFHLVQNDGATTQFFDRNLVNTVADGIYHLGFEIRGDRFLNEDGDANATLADVASWLNFFYGNATLVNGSDAADRIRGDERGEQINAGGGNDTIAAGAGNDLIYGGHGNDSIDGGDGNDLIYAGKGDDTVNGGAGDDTIRVTGNAQCGFEGYDSYADAGGSDRIVAYGGAVDIGMRNFTADSGIESIDATGATGPVRLLGDCRANILDFSATTLSGNIAIDGGGGNDTITGSAGNDVIEGGRGNQAINGGTGDDIIHAGNGNDTVGGGDGNDIFRVTGTRWSGFEGWDSYDGGAGNDTIAAYGGRVDIGLTGFSAVNGIEAIDATGATGPVRILGDASANSFDFSSTTLVGHIEIDGGGGNDTIIGSAGAEVIRGGESGNDTLNGRGGNDVLFGGNGRDVFVFEQGWGRDVVADYRDNYDRLDFHASGATGFSGVSIAQVGVDTVITVGADQVVLLGVNAASVNQADFIF